MSTAQQPQRLFPIRTQQARVPFVWFPFLAFPGLTSSYIEFCSGVPMTFTVKKFVSDPALIAFLISINMAFNFLVSPISSYLGDKVWTRFGRRRVFLVPGWTGLLLCLLLLPLMPNIWALAAVVFLYQFFQDMAASHLQPLNYEIVPPPQRGRFQMITQVTGSLFGIFLNLVILAQFDDRHPVKFDLGPLGSWEGMITGEQVVYWFGALLVGAIVLFLTFCIKEEVPLQKPASSGKFSPRSFVADTYGSEQFRPIYILCVGVCITVAGMATMNTLMITEQFGYSKAVLGQVNVYRDLANMILFVPLLGFLVDRFPRFYLTLFGLCGLFLTNVCYYVYLKVGLDGAPPPYAAIATLGVILAFFGTCWSMSHAPNCFDYVPSNRFGTYLSGQTLLIGFLLFLLPNAYGLWVKGYSALFCEPGTYDYTSIYLLNFVLSSLGIGCALYFWHKVRHGDLRKRGLEEHQERCAAEGA